MNTEKQSDKLGGLSLAIRSLGNLGNLMGTDEVVGIVGECQSLGELPEAPGATIALLLFATAHGVIAIEATGGLHPEKGLAGPAPGLELLVQLLSPRA